MNRAKNTGSISRMTGLSLFTAIIVVLTLFCTFVKFGPVSITLALAPIIIGAAIYGAGAGAFLGLVFSAVVLLTGIFGWDGGFMLSLMAISPLGLFVTVLVKGTAAGYIAGLTYRLIAKKSESRAVLVSGIVCPVVNTGIFVLCMFAFFLETLEGMAAANGQNMLVFIVLGLAGVNFVIELLVNIALSSGISYIIRSQTNRR